MYTQNLIQAWRKHPWVHGYCVRCPVCVCLNSDHVFAFSNLLEFVVLHIHMKNLLNKEHFMSSLCGLGFKMLINALFEVRVT